MALPTSRNTTYAASSKVKSVDLNDLQDMWVGDKHAERQHTLPAAAFAVKSGTAVLGDGQWTFSATTILVAALGPIIPAAHRLVAVAWYYNRGGAGTITRRVRKRELSVPGAAADLAGPGYPIADTTGAAWETAIDILNLVAVDVEGAWLEIQFDNAGHVFGGVRLTFDNL